MERYGNRGGGAAPSLRVPAACGLGLLGLLFAILPAAPAGAADAPAIDPASKNAPHRALVTPLADVVPCAESEEFKPYALMGPDGVNPAVIIVCRKGQLSAHAPGVTGVAATSAPEASP